MIQYKCPECGKLFDDEIEAEDCIEEHESQLHIVESRKAKTENFVSRMLGQDIADKFDSLR